MILNIDSDTILVSEWKNQYIDFEFGKKLLEELAYNILPWSDTTRVDESTPLRHEVNLYTTVKKGSLKGFISGESEGPPQTPLVIRNDNRNLLQKGKLDTAAIGPKTVADWFSGELLKAEAFYVQKEQELVDRFSLLRDQFRMLRECQDLSSQKNDQNKAKIAKHSLNTETKAPKSTNPTKSTNSAKNSSDVESSSLPYTMHIRTHVEQLPHCTPMLELDTFSLEGSSSTLDGRFRELEADPIGLGSLRYEEMDRGFESMDKDELESMRLKHNSHVKLHHAKEQLKSAIFEYYRSIILLQSYVNLNRTIVQKLETEFFRVINSSKYNQNHWSRSTKLGFETNDLLDKLVAQTKILYAENYEQTAADRKITFENLRKHYYSFNNLAVLKPFYHSLFIFFALFVVGVSVLAFTARLAWNSWSLGQNTEGKYLVQIWGSIFLVELMIILFGINIYVFDWLGINYRLIFDMDFSTALNNEQFMSLACLGFGLLFFFGCFSLGRLWPSVLPDTLCPWLFLIAVLALFFWPGNHLYGSSRRWMRKATWRLLLSGYHHVEFRDFLLGNILCSLAYSSSHIPFFFCVYSHHWSDDSNTCSTANSSAMGFFSALPATLRLLQCARLFKDTGDWFPHFANMLKYFVSAIYYLLLSAYRMDRSDRNRIALISGALLNSVYAGSWDTFVDWSLMQPKSKNFLLRDTLLFKRPSIYYCAIVANFIMRFQWIFYVFFGSQIQQSALVAYYIAVVEVLRRFMWVFFRIENEHITNLAVSKAYREVPLPYLPSSQIDNRILKHVDPPFASGLSAENKDEDSTAILRSLPIGSGEISEISQPRQAGNHSTSLKSRRGSVIENMREAINRAHVKDFQRQQTFEAEDD